MAQRALPSIAGRHRHESVRRHRAPLLSLNTDRGRAKLLTATLGMALLTGVAGGTAAAAAGSDAIGAATGITADEGSAFAAATGDSGNSSVAESFDAATGTSANEDDPAGADADEDDAAAVEAAAGIGADESGAVGAAVGLETGSAAVPRVTTGLAAASLRKKTADRPVVRAATAAWVDPNPSGRVTSCFGPRWGRLHAGVDLAGPNGAPILAAGAGIVVRAGTAQGYGNAILIDHGNGYLTHYGHLSEIEVRVGERVAAGDEIGKEGSTGHSTGPHLHFEVHQGSYQNPIEPTRWMRDHGVDISGCQNA